MEMEYKFEIEDFRQLSKMMRPEVWKDWQADREGGKIHMRTTYFDTEERELDQQRTVLRLRSEGEEMVMALKCPAEPAVTATSEPGAEEPGTEERGAEKRGAEGSGAEEACGLHCRKEFEVVLPLVCDRPPVDLFESKVEGFAEVVPEKVRVALGHELVPVYSARFARQRRYLTLNGSLFELALDQGFLANKRFEVPFLEAELELIDGRPEDLKAMVDIMTGLFDLTPEPLSKYQRCRALDEM